ASILANLSTQRTSPRVPAALGWPLVLALAAGATVLLAGNLSLAVAISVTLLYLMTGIPLVSALLGYLNRSRARPRLARHESCSAPAPARPGRAGCRADAAAPRPGGRRAGPAAGLAAERLPESHARPRPGSGAVPARHVERPAGVGGGDLAVVPGARPQVVLAMAVAGQRGRGPGAVRNQVGSAHGHRQRHCPQIQDRAHLDRHRVQRGAVHRVLRRRA